MLLEILGCPLFPTGKNLQQKIWIFSPTKKEKVVLEKEGGQSIIFLVVKLWSTIVNFFVYNFGESIIFYIN